MHAAVFATLLLIILFMVERRLRVTWVLLVGLFPLFLDFLGQIPLLEGRPSSEFYISYLQASASLCLVGSMYESGYLKPEMITSKWGWLLCFYSFAFIFRWLLFTINDSEGVMISLIGMFVLAFAPPFLLILLHRKG